MHVVHRNLQIIGTCAISWVPLVRVNSAKRGKIRKGMYSSKFALLYQTQLKQDINELYQFLPLRDYSSIPVFLFLCNEFYL